MVSRLPWLTIAIAESLATGRALLVQQLTVQLAPSHPGLAPGFLLPECERTIYTSWSRKYKIKPVITEMSTNSMSISATRPAPSGANPNHLSMKSTACRRQCWSFRSPTSPQLTPASRKRLTTWASWPNGPDNYNAARMFIRCPSTLKNPTGSHGNREQFDNRFHALQQEHPPRFRDHWSASGGV